MLTVVVAACGNGTKPPSVSDEAPTRTTTEIRQAQEAAKGSEVTVSGHLIAVHPSQTLSKIEGTPSEDETDTITWTRWTAK